jgi:hypothetical protein
MIIQGQLLDKDNLNRAFVSKTATGTQPIAGSLNVMGTISGNGSGLNTLNGTNITIGTIADGRLSTNVFLLNTSQTVSSGNYFSAEQKFSRGTYVDPKSGLGAAIKYAQGLAGDTAFFNGDVTMGSGVTPNKLTFVGAPGEAPPTGSTASTGTKIQLYNNVYAFGMETANIWYDSHSGHKFYTNSGGASSTLRVAIDPAGLAIQQALWVGTTSNFVGAVAMNGGATITGSTYLNGNVNLGNAAGNVISIVGTPTFSQNVTINKDLEVQGELKGIGANEFPDPLMASGSVAKWSLGGGTIAFDAAQTPTGTGAYGSLKVSSTSAGAWAHHTYYYDVSPNEWVTFSSYAFCTTTSKNMKFIFNWYDASKTRISQVVGTDVTVATSWQRYDGTLQAPATARYLRFEVQNLGGSGTIMYFSAFQVERGRALTAFKPFGMSNSSAATTDGGITVVGGGVDPTTFGQATLTLWNDNGLAGQISSKNNYGMRLEYGTGNIIIGGTDSGTYTSKVAIGKAVTPTATLDIYGNSGANSARSFRVSYAPNSGSLQDTEFRALADTSGAGVWAAMHAIKGAATYAALFSGSTQVNSGNLTINGGELIMNATAGQTPLKLHGWNNGQGLWLISGNSAEAKFFIQSAQSATPNYDYSVEMSYVPGTAGALNGILKIGQLSRANAAYTHGTTLLYTNGTERLRIDSSGRVGIATGATVRNTLDIKGGVVIGTNAAGILSDGGLSIGNSTVTYSPTTTNYSTVGSTLLLTAATYSVISFLHSGNRVDYIRSGAGTITLGYDGGWGSAAISMPGNTTVGGTLGVTGNTTLSTVTVSGATTLSSTLSVAGTSTLTGIVTMGSRAVVTTSIYSPKFDVANQGNTDNVNNSPWYGIGNSNLTIPTGSGPSVQVAGYYGLALRTYQGEILIGQAGNVGISTGTGTIAQKLHVNGRVRASEFDLDAVNGYGVRFWSGSDLFKIWMSGTTDGTWGGGVTGAATSDYNMYFKMAGGGTNRGFVFITNTGKVAQIEGTGRIHTAQGVRVANKFEMTYNSTEDSLDFVYG